MKNTITTWAAALMLWALPVGCSGGGGGGNAGGGPGAGGGTARPWSIDDAALNGMSTDLLAAGDAFLGENDLNSAAAIGDRMWAAMSAQGTWVGTNPIYTYQFYDDTDPFTNWGRAFRYTGFSVYAGPVVGPPTFLGTGTYIAAGGQQYDAVIMRTWDDTYWELLILQSNTIFTHATQHVNGLPLIETYTLN